MGGWVGGRGGGQGNEGHEVLKSAFNESGNFAGWAVPGLPGVIMQFSLRPCSSPILVGYLSIPSRRIVYISIYILSIYLH